MNPIIRLTCLLTLCFLFSTGLQAQEATPEAVNVPALDTLPEAPTPEQIEEARMCAIEGLAQELYGELTLDELAEADAPETPCEWAALAFAYSEVLGEGVDLTDEAKAAFANAVQGNPALAFTPSLLFVYVGEVDLVESPFAGMTITEMEIDYHYSGIGNTIAYTVRITEADSDEPVVEIELESEYGYDETPEVRDEQLTTTIDPELVAAFGEGLTDLLPTADSFDSVPCWDNYPDWTVTLTFEDGTEQVIRTYESNFFFVGGPFQTEIDGQHYVQYSFDFIDPLIALTEALELPLGTTAAMGCGGLEPFEDAYPLPEGTEREG